MGSLIGDHVKTGIGLLLNTGTEAVASKNGLLDELIRQAPADRDLATDVKVAVDSQQTAEIIDLSHRTSIPLQKRSPAGVRWTKQMLNHWIRQAAPIFSTLARFSEMFPCWVITSRVIAAGRKSRARLRPSMPPDAVITVNPSVSS